MVKFVNGNLYNVDLQGEQDAEFDGQHPTLIIQMKEEERIYIVIPFTSYTEERWRKLKRHMCCRVKSTNSIARIDKLEIINADEIKNPWQEADEWLSISEEDLKFVCNKALEYVKSSLNKAIVEHSKYETQLNNLKDEFEDTIINENINNVKILSLDFESESLIISIDFRFVNKLSIKDIYFLFNKVFDRKKYFVRFDNASRIVCINVEKTDKKALTLKEKYDSLNIVER